MAASSTQSLFASMVVQPKVIKKFEKIFLFHFNNNYGNFYKKNYKIRNLESSRKN